MPDLPQQLSDMHVNGLLTASDNAPNMSWAAESMPHEYMVREVADLAALDNVEFGELKQLNNKVVRG
jgi:hypothetical protein